MKKELKVVIIVSQVIGLIIFTFISFVSAVVINEIVTDAQIDRDGSGTVSSDDEYFELYNAGVSSVNLTGWSLSLIDNTNESHLLNGIIKSGGFFTVLNPVGNQNNDGRIELLNSSGGIIDSVSYGNYNDGNNTDNAPSGNSNDRNDECLARFPNGVDTDIDSDDFKQLTCTFNNTNNFVFINNKNNVSCAFGNKNVTLSVDVNGSNIDTVIFSYTINGTNINSSGSKTLGSLVGYEYTIKNSELVGGNVSWNVYVNDTFGNNFFNGLKNFYVRNKTFLSVSPSSPDGDNGWYISEPIFSLSFDNFALRSYFRWDAIADVLYLGIFNLDGIPNPKKESAGILDLNYYSEFNCEDGSVINETNQKQIFKVDLVGPDINDLQPANNSIVFFNSRPEISALLDEVYGGNSGINKKSVYMRIDGSMNNSTITLENSSSLDMILRHTPASDLSDGQHSVMVYVEDLSGKSNSTSWIFSINTSFPVFNLTVNMPNNVSYDNRRIPINISTSELVDLIEYINYDDKRPRWKILCRNCDGYGDNRFKKIGVNDGDNYISIRVINGFVNKSEDIVFFVDRRKPKISKVLPKRNSVTNGTGFFIKFVENDVQKVLISYNPSVVLDLNECVSVGRSSMECTVDLNLSDFDGQEMKYNFNVSDSVNEIMSKVISVEVDTTSPIMDIVSPMNITYGKKVSFNISVSEDVKIEYIDTLNRRPRWRRLCNNCDGYGVDRLKKKRFKLGSHVVKIRTVDKAGNSDTEEVVFNVI